MSGDNATPLQRPVDTATEYQALKFLIWQQLLKVQTITLVQVQAVHGGGIGATPTVDVIPLADQVDGAGNAIPQVTLYGRPCMRWAAGPNAIVLDPQQNDIGVMGFASRDISSILSSRQHGPPPSARAFAYADGIYLGGLPNAAPQNYVQIDTDGTVNILSTQAINLKVGSTSLAMDSSGFTLDGPIDANGAEISGSGEITDAAGKVLGTHEHGPGSYTAPSGGGLISGDSGAPV